MIPPTESTALPDDAADGMVRNPVKRLLARLSPKQRRAARAAALAAVGGLLLGGGVLFAWTHELPAFDKLDTALTKGIEESRSQLRNDILNARRVLSGATVGAAVLSVAAALAVALGLWPRLSEYR